MFKYIEGTKSITEVFIRMVKDREDDYSKPNATELSRATTEDIMVVR